jgi:uncharacterized protein YutE (UPF0331/DUF86 family)
MSPINKITIKDKLFRLEQSIKIIEELIIEYGEKIINDEKLKSILYFNLLISIEGILNIGNHILAESFNKPASSYRDIILGLGDNKVIDKDFSLENKDMGDFRNKLIHDYDRVDDIKVYAYATKAPIIFKKFSKYFIDFIEKV